MHISEEMAEETTTEIMYAVAKHVADPRNSNLKGDIFKQVLNALEGYESFLRGYDIGKKGYFPKEKANQND